MASTRSNATAARRAKSAPAETPATTYLTLARRGARLHIAACTTAAWTFTRWAHSADRLAQSVGDELLRRVDRDLTSAELAARVTAAGGTHLRELTALPRAAADHFDARLSHVSLNSKEAR